MNPCNLDNGELKKHPLSLFQGTSQPLSPTSQQPSQELSPAQLTPVTLAQSHTLQANSTQQQGAVQHAYIPGNWNYRGYRESYIALISSQAVCLLMVLCCMIGGQDHISPSYCSSI